MDAEFKFCQMKKKSWSLVRQNVNVLNAIELDT